MGSGNTKTWQVYAVPTSHAHRSWDHFCCGIVLAVWGWSWTWKCRAHFQAMFEHRTWWHYCSKELNRNTWLRQLQWTSLGIYCFETLATLGHPKELLGWLSLCRRTVVGRFSAEWGNENISALELLNSGDYSVIAILFHLCFNKTQRTTWRHRRRCRQCFGGRLRSWLCWRHWRLGCNFRFCKYAATISVANKAKTLFMWSLERNVLSQLAGSPQNVVGIIENPCTRSVKTLFMGNHDFTDMFQYSVSRRLHTLGYIDTSTYIFYGS